MFSCCKNIDAVKTPSRDESKDQDRISIEPSSLVTSNKNDPKSKGSGSRREVLHL